MKNNNQISLKESKLTKAGAEERKNKKENQNKKRNNN